jgi:hypothetical protein
MTVTPVSRKLLVLGGGILLGAACFFLGRLSVERSAPTAVSTGSKAPDHSALAAGSGTVSGTALVPATRENRMVPSTKSSSAWDEKQWSQVTDQPGSPARNAAMAALLEKLAAVDPDRAMALAQGEDNLKLRESLVQASLRGWARLSATNAANWALALPDSDARDHALSSVFAGAVAANPELAVQLSRHLIEQNPDEALTCGSRLIDALSNAGSFETAARFAASGDQQTRSFWLPSAYSKWAEFQPEQAARAASDIKDPALRNEALHGIVGGWADADPVALVEFVTKLPPETDRGSILSQSLQYWVKHDAEAASLWINENEPGPEMNQGIAAVAAMESLKPEVAIGWAESVTEPKLRSETLVIVLRNWMTADLPAARSYFEKTKDLLPDDRQQIADCLAVIGGQKAGQ